MSLKWFTQIELCIYRAISLVSWERALRGITGVGRPYGGGLYPMYPHAQTIGSFLRPLYLFIIL